MQYLLENVIKIQVDNNMMKLAFILVLCCAASANQPRVMTVCNGMEILSCPSGHVIKITTARYGKSEGGKCGNDESAHCELEGSFRLVSLQCNGKAECHFSAGLPFLPDPCPQAIKQLSVSWECLQIVEECPGRVSSASLEVVHLTSLNQNGGWFRDPLQYSEKIYVLEWFKFNSEPLKVFNSPQKMIDNKALTIHRLDHRVDGSGFVVYDGNLYYNKESGRYVVKEDLIHKEVLEEKLPEANYHGTSPYGPDLYGDIDLAVDESGLWAIYATEGNTGNIVVSKLNHETLKISGTWLTSYPKLDALNAFIACGALYVINYDTLHIDYVYDMTSETESYIHIPIPGLNQTVSSLKYNPKDKMLYIWDSKAASKYKVNFHVAIPTTTTTTTTSTTPTTTTTSRITATAKSSSTSPVGTVASHTSSVLPVKGTCSGREANGLWWPETNYSDTAVLSCPGSTDSKAYWVCGGNSIEPKWSTSEPDFSNCVSIWIKDLENEFDVGKVPVAEIGQKLARNLNSNKDDMISWDIVVVVNLLQRLLEESSSDLQGASIITDVILESTSHLLHPQLTQQWEDLSRNIQTGTATKLANVLEDAAFILSKDKINESSTEPLRWKKPYASLEIRIEPVRAGKHDDKIQLVFQSDQVMATLDTQSLSKSLDGEDGDMMIIIFLAFKNIARHIVDKHGIGTGNYPTNSHVIACSAKIMKSDGVIAASGNRISLNHPIRFTFHHTNQQYNYHMCSYWDELKSDDESKWWASGCRRTGGNESTSVCECNHLTKFALLSSNNPFPPMGVEDDKDPEERFIGIFLYLTVVRIGSSISVILLLTLIVVLFRWIPSCDLSTIHKNLAFSVLVGQLTLMIAINLTSIPPLCAVVAGFLHYVVLCTFSWAVIESLHLLLTVKDLTKHATRWKYYYVIGYVTPLVVVGVSAVADYHGYVSDTACWVQTNGPFMWSVIIPCSLATCTSLICIAMLMYELNQPRTTTADKESITSIRNDAIKSCTLMILLCVMWSFVFLWINGIPLMAWLVGGWFVLYGSLSLILRCHSSPVCLPRACNWFHSRKNRCRFSRSKPSATTLVSRSLRQSTRSDGSAPSFDYHYAAGRTATTSTIVPTIKSSPALFSNSSPLEEEVTLIVPATLCNDPVTGVRGMELNPRTSFMSTDDRDFDSHRRCEASNSRSYIAGSFRSIQMQGYPGSTCHHYEHPMTSDSICTGTTATSFSCCYDHLHDHPLQKGVLGGLRKLSCNKCTMQTHKNQTYCPQGLSHQYETLGPFSDDENYQECQHCYNDVEAGEVTISRDHDCRLTCPQQHPGFPDSACSPSSTWLNSSYGVWPCPRGSGGKFRLRSGNGRSSDPLSTDQGYDTDSQQPGHHQHSDGDNTRSPGSTPDGGSKMNTLLEVRETYQQNDSLSGRSDNDKEVEMINCTPSAPLPTINHTATIQQPPNVQNLSHNDVMQTSLSGRNSASVTVHSWSALPGSNPRSKFPHYGLNKLSRKTTTDPQLILAQARCNCDVQRSIHDISEGTSDNKQTVSSGYTLPGTSETGTKAKIDLHSGGINMITNL